jgi:hypothetical protein
MEHYLWFYNIPLPRHDLSFERRIMDSSTPFPYRADLGDQDPLRITDRMDTDLLAKIDVTESGCITVPSDFRIRLVNGKRIRPKRYIFMRCISGNVADARRVTSLCCRRKDRRTCISPSHLRLSSRQRLEISKPDPPKEKKKIPVDSGDSLFSDLPPVTAPRNIIILDSASTPEAPKILDCFRILDPDMAGEKIQFWERNVNLVTPLHSWGT